MSWPGVSFDVKFKVRLVCFLVWTKGMKLIQVVSDIQMCLICNWNDAVEDPRIIDWSGGNFIEPKHC